MGDDHHADLVTAYEGETSAEAYFLTLATWHSGLARRTLEAFAAVEHVTAAALAPAVRRLALPVADVASLQARGVARAEAERDLEWEARVEWMCANYPPYVSEFERALAIAPPAQREVLQLLVDHEVALVEAAERLRTGHPEPLAPVEQFVRRGR